MGEKYEPKSMTSAELTAHGQQREERGRKVQAAAVAMQSMAQCLDALDQLLPLMEQFDKERQRLGEYDASAAAIMQIAEINLKLTQLNRAWLKAHIDLILETM